jgi:squalene-hopene/tetraprenyl-beta-curcumene cyclase
VLGLLASGDLRSDSVHRGVAYLLQQQKRDGSWDEQHFTGTGFPRVFYLAYHLYRHYFPLLALTEYSRKFSSASNDAAVGSKRPDERNLTSESEA